MEVVGACGSDDWSQELPGRACGDGGFGLREAAMDDVRVIEMRAGDVFYIGPGHDSWVVGDEPYVSLHFMGAEKYAEGKGK